MLPPGSPGLRREEALSLIGRLQAAEHRIVDLERELYEAAARRHPAGGGEVTPMPTVPATPSRGSKGGAPRHWPEHSEQ